MAVRVALGHSLRNNAKAAVAMTTSPIFNLTIASMFLCMGREFLWVG